MQVLRYLLLLLGLSLAAPVAWAAVLSADAGDGYYRTTDLMDYDSTYTVVGWIYVDDLTDDNAFFAMYYNDTANKDLCVVGEEGQLCARARDTSVGSWACGSNGVVTEDAWYYIQMQRDGNNSLKCFLNGSATEEGENTDTMTRTNASHLFLGGRSHTDYDAVSDKLAHYRAWTSLLTNEEVRKERCSATAQKASPRWAYEFANGALTTDSSGNGRTLTTYGTPSHTANPTLPACDGSPTMVIIVDMLMN